MSFPDLSWRVETEYVIWSSGIVLFARFDVASAGRKEGDEGEVRVRLRMRLGGTQSIRGCLGANV